MKTKTFALLLLTLFVVSSLEAVWADKDFESEDFDESEDVSVNDFNEIEEDEFDILSKGSCKGKKVKSHDYESGRCLSSTCKIICKKDGFKNGKCTTTEKSDKVNKCYCIKSCHKKHTPTISPASPPSAFPPADVPSSVVPDFSPTNAPSPTPDTPDSPMIEFPDLPPVKSIASLEEDDADDSEIY